MITDLCRNVESSKILFNTLEALYVHFSKPPEHKILNKTAEILQNKKIEITAQSSTRWTCRYTNCEKVINNYNTIKEALNFEIENCENSNVSEAIGLINSIYSAEFIVNLFIFHNILKLCHVLSQILQKEDTTLGAASVHIKGLISTLTSQRSDSKFEEMWTDIKEFADTHDISLETPRRSKKRKNVKYKDSCILSTIGQTSEEHSDDLTLQNFWKIRYVNKKNRALLII